MHITIQPSAHGDLYFLKVNGIALTLTGNEIISLCDFVTAYIKAHGLSFYGKKKTKAAH